jgi:hypothetical protein
MFLISYILKFSQSFSDQQTGIVIIPEKRSKSVQQYDFRYPGGQMACFLFKLFDRYVLIFDKRQLLFEKKSQI